MNRNRMIMGLAFAVVVALLLSTFVYRQLKQAAATAAPAPMQHIVVAATALPLGTRLDSSKLKLVPWVVGEPVTGMCTQIADCSNRALKISVAENEPILENKLAPTAAGAGLAATIPEGMRAMSVAVNDVVGVAGFVTPGTMVDVLVTGAISGQNQTGGQNITRTILENVRVLAAGQKVEQDAGGKPQTVPVITLLVSPEDAGKLAMASNQGKIQLALRNTVDADSTAPPAVLQSALFASDGTVQAPVKLHIGAPSKPAPPPAPYTVEVISGDKRETKTFPNQ